MPAISGWSSGIAPQPIRVGITGTPSSSASSTSRSAGVGVDDAAAGDDQRPLGRGQHVERLLDLRPGGRRLVDRQRLVGVEVELDLGHLHVDRQVDQHRARAGPERIRWNACWKAPGHLRRLQHGHRHLGHRLGDGRDVDGLEVLLVQPGDAAPGR